MICEYEWDAHRRDYHATCRSDDGTDVATAIASTVDALRAEMTRSIEFYREVCEKHGRTPKLTLPVPQLVKRSSSEG